MDVTLHFDVRGVKKGPLNAKSQKQLLDFFKIVSLKKIDIH